MVKLSARRVIVDGSIVLTLALLSYHFAVIFRAQQLWCSMISDESERRQCYGVLAESVDYDLCRRVGEVNDSVDPPFCKVPYGDFVTKFSRSAWKRYVNAAENCEVIGIATSHSGRITATLKDRSEIYYVQPPSGSVVSWPDKEKTSRCPKLQFRGTE